MVASSLAAVASKLLLRCAFRSERMRPACLAAMLTVAGVDPNTINVTAGALRSPICLAARWGHATAVAVLLAAPGIDINFRDIHCATPLLLATQHGHADCVEALLAAPAVDMRANSAYVMWRRVLMLMGIVPLPPLPIVPLPQLPIVPLPQLPIQEPHLSRQRELFSALMSSLCHPTALHKASSYCLIKALFLDVSVVADYARCIRMLLSHAARNRRSRSYNVLEHCLDILDNLFHCLALLILETRCVLSSLRVPRRVSHISGGVRGDDSGRAYRVALKVVQNPLLYHLIANMLMGIMFFIPMVSRSRWVLWVLWVATAILFMGMCSVRETLLVIFFFFPSTFLSLLSLIAT